MNIKRILSGIIAGTMLFQTAVFANEKTFEIIPEYQNEPETVSEAGTQAEDEDSVYVYFDDGDSSAQYDISAADEETGYDLSKNTRRNYISSETEPYSVALPENDETRIIVSYVNDGTVKNVNSAIANNSVLAGTGNVSGTQSRKIGDGQFVLNLEKNSINAVINDENWFVEPDNLVHKTTLDVTWETADLDVLRGVIYPGNFDNIKVKEYHDGEITGKGVKIAILDTGLDCDSTELNICGGAAFVDGVNSFSDDNGHGTAMAGIIGAAMDNVGLTGIAPDAELYSVKVLDSKGNGYVSAVTEGVNWAVANGMDIIFFGFAGKEYSYALSKAVENARDNNILMIAPAGNDGQEKICYPAGYDGVVSVGSVDNTGSISRFSNYGSYVDVYAFGEKADSILYVNNKPTECMGTSVAAAQVAGFAALAVQEKRGSRNFDAYDYIVGGDEAENFGFVRISGDESAAGTLNIAENAFASQNADFVVMKSTENAAVMAAVQSDSSSGTRITIGTPIISSIPTSSKVNYYYFVIENESEIIKFNLEYEDESKNLLFCYKNDTTGSYYSVKGQTLVLKKGIYSAYVCGETSSDYGNSNYTLCLESLGVSNAVTVHYLGDGVNEATGNFGYTFDDIKTVIAGKDFIIRRSYNSNDNINGLFSRGWRLNLECSAKYVKKEYLRENVEYVTLENQIAVTTPDGEILYFERQDDKYEPLNSRAEFSSNDTLTTDIRIKIPQSGVTYYYKPLESRSGTSSRGCLYKIVDSNGNAIVISWDNDKITKITDYIGNEYTFAYSNDNLISITDNYGRSVSYEYENNRLSGSCSADGKRYYYEYNDISFLKKISDENNNVINVVNYDFYNSSEEYRVSSVTDKFGTEYKYYYDDTNFKTTVKVVEDDGEETFFSETGYDAERDVTYFTDAANSTVYTKYFYYETGELSGRNSPKLSWIVIDDDYTCRKNGEISVYETPYSYTEFSFETLSGRPNAKNVYRSSGKNILVASEKYEYDNNDNIKKKSVLVYKSGTTGYYKVTLSEYDGKKPVRVAEYMPAVSKISDVTSIGTNPTKFAVTSYSYINAANYKGLVSKITYPEQYTGADSDKSWLYEYDGNGNCISVTNPESSTQNEIKELFEYNSFGLVTKHTSANGNVEQYEYDDSFNITKKLVATPSGTAVYRTVYNYLNLPTQIVEPEQYNASFEQADGSYGDSGAGVRYEYDTTGTLIKKTDAEGNVYSYSRDGYGNIVKKVLPGGGVYLYIYDKVSNLNATFFKNSKDDEQVYYVDEHNYSKGNSVHLTTKYDSDRNIISSIQEVTNYFGKISEISDASADGYGEIREFRYDYAGNLANEYELTDGTDWRVTYYKTGSFDSTKINLYDEKFVCLSTASGKPVLNAVTKPPSGNQYKYERTIYDKNGNVIKTMAAKSYLSYTGNLAASNAVVETNEYYADNLLKSHTDDFGVVTNYEYDNDRNLSKMTVVENNSTVKHIEYENNYNGKPLKIKTYVFDNNITDSENLLTDDSGTYILTENTYDKNGNLVKQVSNTGLVTEYTYDGNNLQLSVSSYENGNKAAKQTESVVYDGMCNVVEKTDKNGNTTKFVYTKSGQLAYTLYPNGKTQLTVYDLHGRIITEVNPVDYTGNVSFENADISSYAADLRNLSNMNRTVYAYDKLERVVSETRYVLDPYTQTWKTKVKYTNEYDALGNVLSVTDACGNILSYEYDILGNLIKYIEPDKKDIDNAFTIKYTYDALGRKTQEGNSSKQYYLYTYDNNGNLTYFKTQSGTSSAVTVSAYTYTNGARIYTQKDGKNNITTLVYDSNMRLSRQYDQGGESDPSKTDYYKYYVKGNLSEHQNKNGDVIGYEYDSFDRLVKKTSPDGDVVYTYDKNGNILTVADGSGTVTYVYDSMGRILSKGHSLTGTVTYSYDNYNGVPYGLVCETTTTPDGSTVEKWYDSEDKIYRVIDGENITKYDYYDNGKLKSVTRPDGAVSVYTYDGEGNLLTLVTTSESGSVLDSFSYTYSDSVSGAKNIASKTETLSGELVGTTSYEYSILGQLTKTTYPNGKTTTYTYDKAGNRVSKKSTVEGQPSSVTYTYDNQNRLTNTVADNTVRTFYTYDNNGNLILRYSRLSGTAPAGEKEVSVLGADGGTDDASAYEYDSYDRLVRILQGDTEIENTYDGEGRNIYRKTNGKAKLFVYDGNTVIYETGTGGAENARNVYGINLISRTVPGTTALYGYNGHGDVINLTSEGTVVAAYYYDEFGNHADIENHAGVFAELFTDEESAEFDNPYRYAGYEYLENADLYDLNARYYDAKIARFLSPDPYYNLGNRVIGLYEINIPDAFSIMQANALYVYCGNNSVNFVDSSGEAAIAISVGSALLVKAAPYIITGVAAIGAIMFAEHHKKGTTNPSNLSKHEKGQKRKKTDKFGGEKGDTRRTPRKDKKK